MCGGVRVDPMDRTLDLAVRGCSGAAPCFRIVAAVQFHDVARTVLDHLVAANDVGVSQSYFATGLEPEVLRRRSFHKVIALDVEDAGEGQGTGASIGILGIVNRRELFGLAFWIIGQHHLDGIEDRHVAIGDMVKMFAGRILENQDIDRAVEARHPDRVAEVSNRFGGETPTAKAAQGGHAGIVPTCNVPFGHQLQKLALAHHSVRQIQSRKLHLPWMVDAKRLAEPVVERTMVLEFKCADRMRDAFDGIGLTVRPIVHWIDAPGVPRAMMVGVHDAVENRIAKIEICGGHIDLGAKGTSAIWKFAGLHAFEQVEIFFGSAIAERAISTRLGQCPAVFTHRVRIQIADISMPFPDQLNRPCIQLIKVIRGVVQSRPFESQPTHVRHDRVDIFLTLFGRVGIVEPKIALTRVALGQTKIQADAFGMPDVQVTVGFGRKPGLQTATTQNFSRGKVFFNFNFNEVLMWAVGRSLGWFIHRWLNSVVGIDSLAFRAIMQFLEKKSASPVKLERSMSTNPTHPNVASDLETLPASEPSPAKQDLEPPYTGTREQLAAELKAIAATIGLNSVPENAWTPLAQYCLRLWDWNTKINLTRHTTPSRFVHRDLLDSVELAKLLRHGEEILDIGTGGGVPGIVIAILRPDVQVTLCDNVAKKAKVAQDIVEHLGLSVPVYPLSVRKVLEDFRYDSLVARGVGPLPRLCGWLKDEWHKIGRLLAIKGPKWVEERGEARHLGLLKRVDLRRMAAYPMPDTHSESTILQLSRQMGAEPVQE